MADGVTKLNMAAENGHIESNTVTPREPVNFTLQAFEVRYGQSYTEYSFNGSDMKVIGDVRTITIAWSKEINNS